MTSTSFADVPDDPQTSPYASPQAFGTETPTTDVEAIRMAHLSHEASVRSVGSLYYLLGGILTAIMLVSLIVVGVTWGTFEREDIFRFAIQELAGEPIFFAILFGMLTISFGIGRGLRTLRCSAQIVAGLISTLGLLAFPTLGLLAFPTLTLDFVLTFPDGTLLFTLFTLFNGYILYLLFSSKGNRVFSAEYKAVIERTPHVVCRQTIVLIVPGVILLLLLLTFMFFVFSVLNAQ